MTQQHATVAELRRAISTEVLIAFGLARTSPLQPLLRPLVWPPAHRFAHLAAGFDRQVAAQGWTAAVRWVLPRFVDGVHATGTEHVPASGPLVVVSNHPGSYDVLALSAALGRDDLKILVSDVPFLRNMVAASRHLIYTDTAAGTEARMGAARESIRHLRSGGALLVFASAQVDPDPAILPGAEEALGRWSASPALFLRRVPDLRLLVAIVSGVLAPACFHHPLARIRREQRLRQFLAEFLQVSQQVLFGRRFGLEPVVRFAPALGAPDLGAGTDVRAALLRQARQLLVEVPGQVPGSGLCVKSE
jgi:hypothetical protein